MWEKWNSSTQQETCPFLNVLPPSSKEVALPLQNCSSLSYFPISPSHPPSLPPRTTEWQLGPTTSFAVNATNISETTNWGEKRKGEPTDRVDGDTNIVFTLRTILWLQRLGLFMIHSIVAPSKNKRPNFSAFSQKYSNLLQKQFKFLRMYTLVVAQVSCLRVNQMWAELSWPLKIIAPLGRLFSKHCAWRLKQVTVMQFK